jgi:hypothetical protein
VHADSNFVVLVVLFDAVLNNTRIFTLLSVSSLEKVGTDCFRTSSHAIHSLLNMPKFVHCHLAFIFFL